MQLDILKKEAIDLLCELISIPSISREEDKTADRIEEYIVSKGYSPERIKNNICVRSKLFDPQKPTILLNSHHDTVRPGSSWTYVPYSATIEGDKIIGLGSNDAGASLVSLLATFLFLDNIENRPYNIIYAATAEEEVSGTNGVELILDTIGHIDFGIVGEPTQMQMAIAEKGLMVLDCTAHGKTGHAARSEGVNAIYKAIEDIQWFQQYRFEKETDFLGPVKMTVSIINAGKQHNVVPDSCTFTVDVRTNECYTNKEVFDIISKHTKCDVNARSFRLNSSAIEITHTAVERGKSLNMQLYGSPTMSDQVFMQAFPTIKIGPGDSARSHTPDEYIFMQEIKDGIDTYIQLLDNLKI